MADFTGAQWTQYATSSQVQADDFQRVVRGILLTKLIAILQGAPTAGDITTAKAIVADIDGWTRKTANLLAASSLAVKIAAGTLTQADITAGVTAAMWTLLGQLIV
jgi:hypothetical protein